MSRLIGTPERNYWKLGAVHIYPHIKSNKLFTIEELFTKATNIITKMTDKFPQNKISMYKKDNSYCYEVNGKWNVVIYINIDGYLYHYMLRRDSEFNESFGCPLVNIEYVGEKTLKNKILSKETLKNNMDIWEYFEKCVCDELETTQKIIGFNT